MPDRRDAEERSSASDASLRARAWTPFWDPDTGRLRAGWRILLAFAIFFGVYIGANRGLDLLSLPDLVGRVGGHLLLLVAVGATLFCSARFLDRRPLPDYGFRFGGAWWIDLAGGLAIGVLLHAAATGVHLGLGWAEVEAIGSRGAFEVPLVAALGIVLVQFVGVGVWEEVLFRGVFILNTAEGLSGWTVSRKTRVVGAWLVSTAVFGALHVFTAGGKGVPPHFVVVQATVAGLYFGLPYLWTGSLALPIGLHVATNFASVALFGGTAPAFENFPALVRLTTTFPGAWEHVGGVALLAQFLTLAVLAAWVYGTRGELSIHATLLRAAARNARPPLRV